MLLATLAVSLAATACAGRTPTAATEAAATQRIYVSLGDSYAAGYQPKPGGQGSTSTHGFAYQVAARTATSGDPLRLVNFGCSGITTDQLLHGSGCEPAARGPGAPDYTGQSQASAAEAFLSAHRSQIALITLVIGGNDVKPCILTADNKVRPDAVACARSAVARVSTNLATALRGIRAAAGPDVPVIGLTYPDMYLGAWVYPGGDAHELATGSVWLFQDLLNPALKSDYTAAGAVFADITAATGGYGSLSDTVSDPPYGTIPKPVERACTLTYFCRLADVHPTDAGYDLIAGQVLDAAHRS